MNEGYIFGIQKGSVHDGPGIRTTVYLQGCPLRCIWCHNPDSWSPPSTGRLVTVAEVLDEVERDLPPFESCEGGLTVSGGEPTYQFEFCVSLLAAAKERGIHTCLDTSGGFPARRLPELLPHVDLWLLDYKATNPPCEWIGIADGPLVRVREDLLASGARVRLRCPLIPGLNDTLEHMARIAQLSHLVDGVDLMPFHRLGVHKHMKEGREYLLEQTPEPTQEQVEAWIHRLWTVGAVGITVG